VTTPTTEAAGAPAAGSSTHAPASAAQSTAALSSPVATGLAPRPPIDPAVMAVLAAAVDQAWPRPVVAAPSEPSILPAWRFSGRWWTKAAAARRERPWS
jgi:hypothetical protein